MAEEEFNHISVRYSILDPTGNITALVESEVAPSGRLAVASQIMERHPEVEQVGFVHFFLPETIQADSVQVELQMAGGEFCGNASMSAAALYLLRKSSGSSNCTAETVFLRVSGAVNPVEVHLLSQPSGCYVGRVHMPPPLSVAETDLHFGDLHAPLPLVRMEGISHLIIRPDSPFFILKSAPQTAEQAVRSWCRSLSADGLGLMFLEQADSSMRLTPLVYVPVSDTVFWENSCASGSSASGMLLAAEQSVSITAELVEPGGTLYVESNPVSGETWLSGTVRLLAQHTL